ncbi:hypothetical protein [Agitococcus lubricus]|uniref:Dual specificity protein phosphatase-like protein n=1 Tax=Agitococcus lubricus TaxID=1077255 RepID=A0A2T5IZ43_9GAMM|nr:hypothetical protein [Agitococcus lubricus]PTQ89275.1 hypothetical protein C8N29_1073 [Agitococcus lubricus]
MIKDNPLKNMIFISSLPTFIELQILFYQGLKELINVSGIDLDKIYPQYNLSYFNEHTFIFSDLFSKAKTIESFAELEALNSTLFKEHFNIEQQQAFKSAVYKAIELLYLNKSLYIFCHQGVGRSPAVSFAALTLYYQLPMSESLKMIHAMRPQAKITTMTISATYWLKENLSHEQFI